MQSVGIRAKGRANNPIISVLQTGSLALDIALDIALGTGDGFDEDNHQIRPLRFSVKTDQLTALTQSIQEETHYRVEVVDVDEQDETHLLLHRANE